MHGQIAAIIKEFESAEERLNALVDEISEQQWSTTVDPTQWTAAQCIQHLNLTSRAFLPVIRNGLDECRKLNGKAPTKYRFDFAGWMIWRASGPTRGFGRLRTTAPFMPVDTPRRSVILEEFARLQQEQIQCARDGDGLRLSKVRVVSPFNQKLRYNLFSALSILPHHQHRHIQQAERAAKRVAAA